MNEELKLLITLNDLDTQINELKLEEKMGFSIDKKKEIKKAKERIISKLSKETYELYERIRKRYGHAVVPAIDGVCYGCYTTLPTAFVSKSKNNKELTRCPYCGRFLYWSE